MATRNYLDRIMPRRSLGGFYTSSLTSLNDGGTYSSAIRRPRQHHYLPDTKTSSNKTSSSLQASSPVMASSEHAPERSPSRSQLASSHRQSSLDLMGSSLKCDDCQTNDGLFQCCHCNQRLCIRCCNKHYKKVTVELERLHELSDRLLAKIVHTKNDLERQKNETLEQCHKWRVDTINSINKAHTLIVQTIHNEYDLLGKEYELFVQKEMAHLNVDQNELMRMKKGNLGSLLSSPSSSIGDSTNPIDTIRKRIETFARNIDETGKFSFQVQLPRFDIDDSLRVESRFGDVTRCTSATWQNDEDRTFSSPMDGPGQDEIPINNVQSTETDGQLTKSENGEVSVHTNEEIEEPSDKIDEPESDPESHSTSSSAVPCVSPDPSTYDSNSTLLHSSRYALSVDNDIELQQQQFYRPSFRSDRYDSAYGTAPSSPSSSLHNHHDYYSSASSLQDHSYRKFSYPSSHHIGSFYNNRRHTHTMHRASSSSSSSSPTFAPSNDNEDTYRSVQHVQLKQEEDGSLEGMAIQIEQSHKTEGPIKQSRTCVEACAVRRRTTAIPPQSSSSTSTQSSNDQPWLYYRAASSPSFIQ